MAGRDENSAATSEADRAGAFADRPPGVGWTQISPDLTFDIDRSQLPIMGPLPSDSMLSRHDGRVVLRHAHHLGRIATNRNVLVKP